MNDEAKRIHDELRAIAEHRQQLHAREALLLVQAEDLELWRHFGCATFFEYLERFCDLHPRTAREHIRVARALKHLPDMRTQLGAHRIPYSTARELTRVATPDTESDWLLHVAGMSPREIEHEVSGRNHGDRPNDPRDPDRMVKLVLEVRSSTYAQFVEARARYSSDRGERLTDDDLVLALCRPDQPNAPYNIALSTCRSCAKSFQIAGGREVEISPAMLACAQCDATHLGDLESDAPQRTKSTVSPAKRRKVLARDGYTCRVPGCRSQRHLDVHHVVFQMNSGSNKLSNLTSVCAGHHRQLHEGKLTVTGKAPHALTFTAAAERDPLSHEPTEMVTHDELMRLAEIALDELQATQPQQPCCGPVSHAALRPTEPRPTEPRRLETGEATACSPPPIVAH